MCGQERAILREKKSYTETHVRECSWCCNMNQKNKMRERILWRRNSSLIHNEIVAYSIWTNKGKVKLIKGAW